MPGDEQPASTEVSHVGIKIPPFWQKNPVRWFSQVEAQFALRKVTQDETKFHYIVAHLDQHVAEEFGDIINSPPKPAKFSVDKI
ncbi:hypothetical protein NQ317_013955 [Molorchus minor]|uniref:DUF7041 domain-containing protein n=1 Tax=Molorchus minor TaxID=1323400 RepID=A0ABQ9JVH2_9CUCU|nr:hypothetical protein NQ317_013955 [Molorchus minor]